MANNSGTLSSGTSRATATGNYSKSSFSATSTVNGSGSQNGLSFNNLGSMPQMPLSATSGTPSGDALKQHHGSTPETLTEDAEEIKRRRAQTQANANIGREDEESDEDDAESKTYVNPHQNVLDLPHAFYVDQAIMTEEDRLVVIRFGDHRDPDCQRQDEVLEKCAKMTHQWCVFYKCDNRRSKVPDFNQMYEL